eukprot:7516945-Pyramimonas_sp.AAC.1
MEEVRVSKGEYVTLWSLSSNTARAKGPADGATLDAFELATPGITEKPEHKLASLAQHNLYEENIRTYVPRK